MSSLIIESFVDAALGNSAYLVGSRTSKQAALIDPLRDVERYRHAAEQLGLTITYVLDTHLHNDFVSGARELGALLGSQIGASGVVPPEFEHRALTDGDELSLGDIGLRVLATPGHTPEHIAFLAHERSILAALFSGGALMVGGAARTDLLGPEHTLELTHQLHDTLHHKLLSLPDEVRVFPTHGAGTFCAAPTSSERTSTIGQERRLNRLALTLGREAFVQLALSGLPSYPIYYTHVRAINRRGPRILGGLPVLRPLSAEEVHEQLPTGVVVLDVRLGKLFAAGHIPDSYGIQVDAPLSTWAGWLIPFGTPLILIATNAAERQAAVRHLIRIGFDDLRGYLEGGLEAWAKAGYRVDTVPTLSARELRERLHGGEALTVVDVRQKNEWEASHLAVAQHIENGRLAWDTLPIPMDTPVAIHCARGVRSMAGISVLRRRGYRNVMQVEGGFNAWVAAGFEVVK